MDLDAIHELAGNPEYASVEDFVLLCIEDERETFSHLELRAIALNMRCSGNKIRTDLEGYGLRLASRATEKPVRGFKANCHDRWVNSGNHGGSGHEQIQGFAGGNG
jgi:hypothetical protein